MGFTTRLELHSQATRLVESAPYGLSRGTDGIVTLYDGTFKCTCPRDSPGVTPLDYNSTTGRQADFQVEHFPLHSQLLGESWLVSFPPLNDMLKFSGFSYLISGQSERVGGAGGAEEATALGAEDTDGLLRAWRLGVL